MDADNSGALDPEELAMALSAAAASSDNKKQQMLEEIATELVSLYDTNGDGVVDREEYEYMVNDMAALQELQRQKAAGLVMAVSDGAALIDEDLSLNKPPKSGRSGWLRSIRNLVSRNRNKAQDDNNGGTDMNALNNPLDTIPNGEQLQTEEEQLASLDSGTSEQTDNPLRPNDNLQLPANVTELQGSDLSLPGSGTIVFADMRVDLRRLPFGAIPVIKSVSRPESKKRKRERIRGIIFRCRSPYGKRTIRLVVLYPFIGSRKHTHTHTHIRTHSLFVSCRCHSSFPCLLSPCHVQITPGGPLFLEPFTATVNGSFNKDDVMGSNLLDLGLRRLVARALRLRVRSFRDVLDGAVFVGRSWNMASKMAPVVEVPRLTNVEFDSNDRLVMTGIARVQTSPDLPVVENAFKVRTRLGTGRNGRTIRLDQPELALVLECPKAWERK